MDCDEFVELVTDFLEGALPEADEARIRRRAAGRKIAKQAAERLQRPAVSRRAS